MVLSSSAVSELKSWLTCVDEWNEAPVIIRPPDIQLVTHASQVAWGATLGHLHASGQWNVRMSHQSSNMRELMAILLVLSCWNVGDARQWLVYVTRKLRNQAFCEMPKTFSNFLK